VTAALSHSLRFLDHAQAHANDLFLAQEAARIATLTASGMSDDASPFSHADAEKVSADKADVRKLRARKLLKLARKELTQDNLRELFRLLDEDGKHDISSADMQSGGCSGCARTPRSVAHIPLTLSCSPRRGARAGMLLLGFEAAADPVALSRFLLDVDDDRTGTISESEFLGFFESSGRAQIKASLDSYIVGRCCCTATFYGLSAAGRPTMRTEVFDGQHLRAWMAALPANRGRLWLDVVGFSAESYALLAAAIATDPHDLMDALLVQDAKLEIITSGEGAAQRVHTEIILHTRELSESALSTKSPSALPWGLRQAADLLDCCSGDGYVAGASSLQNKRIVSRQELADKPPAISLEQAVIKILDDSTIITLRLPAFGPEKDLKHLREPPPPPAAAVGVTANARASANASASASVSPDPAGAGAAAATPSGAAAAPALWRISSTDSHFSDPPATFTRGLSSDSLSSDNPSPVYDGEAAGRGADQLNCDPSAIRRVYEQLRRDMAAAEPTVAHLFNSSVKGLAIAIVDAILQQNHTLRDELQDWEQVLETSVRKLPTSQHDPHIDALAGLTQLYSARIKHLCATLDPDVWRDNHANVRRKRAAVAAAPAERRQDGSHIRVATAENLQGRDGGGSGGGGISESGSGSAAAGSLTVEPPRRNISSTSLAALLEMHGEDEHSLGNLAVSFEPYTSVAVATTLPVLDSPASPASATSSTSQMPAKQEMMSRLAASRSLRVMVEKGGQSAAVAERARHMFDNGADAGLVHGGALRVVVSGPGGFGNGGSGRPSLRVFFSSYLSELRELAKDLRSVQTTLTNKGVSVAELKRSLAGLKADMMNRTLFTLTLITALSLPLNFLTALWATNFTDASGLDVSPVMIVSPEDLEKFGSTGFRVFWPTLALVLTSVFLAMHRFGLFEALK